MPEKKIKAWKDPVLGKWWYRFHGEYKDRLTTEKSEDEVISHLNQWYPGYEVQIVSFEEV